MSRVNAVLLINRFALSMLILAFFVTPEGKADYEGVFRIGTASKVGTFYRAGAAICENINGENTVYCVPIVTNGSLHNLNLLVSHKLDFAVVKSDVALALNQIGLSSNIRERVNEVRVIAKLHDMPLTIVGRRGEQAEMSAELARSAIINIGLEGSGERIAALELFNAMGLDYKSLSTSMLNSNAVVDAFCQGETDIVIELIAHPARIYDRLINECDGQFLHVGPSIVKEVIALNPYVFSTLIYDGFYSKTPKAYSTYAVSALLIANSDLDPELHQFVTSRLESSIKDIQQNLPEWIHMSSEDFQIAAPPRFIWD